MDAIELAALPETTPLADALDTMRARQQSGLICISNQSFKLITPRDIVLAREGNGSTLADVAGGEHVTADVAELERRDPSVLRHDPDIARLQQHFRLGHRYTVATFDVDRALIITSSETYAHFLGMTVPNYVCSCSNDFHDFDVTPPTCAVHGCAVIRTAG